MAPRAAPEAIELRDEHADQTQPASSGGIRGGDPPLPNFAGNHAPRPARVLPRSETKIAGQVPPRWKAPDVAEEGDERSGDQQSDPGDGSQVLDGGQLLRGGLELAFHLFDSGLDLSDLPARFGEDRPQSFGQVRVGILDEGPHRRHDLTSAHGNEDAQFAKKTTQGIESCRALCHPARTQPMERAESLVFNRLERYG